MTLTGPDETRGPAAPPEEAPPLARVGSYEIFAPIARGGGGSVWLAFDRRSPALLRVVAVKFLHRGGDDDAELRRRFLREAKIGSAIRHTNVVEVLEVGEAEGQPFLVMPYVEGVDVRTLQRGSPLPVAVAIGIVADTLRGLEAAHEATTIDGKPAGVVHRDVSPHNLLVGLDGVTKVTDFGIARPLEGPDRTLTGWGQGKVAYFSPEQSRGEPLDRRSDVFAAGTVLWELLVGRSLFRADDPFLTVHRVQSLRIPAPSAERREVPADLDEVTRRALARDPTERYPSAGAMLAALLEAAATAGIVTGPENVAQHVRVEAASSLAERAAILRVAAREIESRSSSADAASGARSAAAAVMSHADAETLTAPSLPVRRRPALLFLLGVAIFVLVAGLAFTRRAAEPPAAAPEPAASAAEMPSPVPTVTTPDASAPPAASVATSRPNAPPSRPPRPMPRERSPRPSTSTPRAPALPMTANPF